MPRLKFNSLETRDSFLSGTPPAILPPHRQMPRKPLEIEMFRPRLDSLVLPGVSKKKKVCRSDGTNVIVGRAPQLDLFLASISPRGCAGDRLVPLLRYTTKSHPALTTTATFICYYFWLGNQLGCTYILLLSISWLPKKKIWILLVLRIWLLHSALGSMRPIASFLLRRWWFRRHTRAMYYMCYF